MSSLPNHDKKGKGENKKRLTKRCREVDVGKRQKVLGGVSVKR
jgi:hypothetical protein